MTFNKTNNYKTMKVIIEKQEDGSFIAYNTEEADLSLIGTGNTVSEAKTDFFNSIKEVKEVLTDEGKEIPAALQTAPEFSFDISSLFEYYPVLNMSAFARFIGINETLMRQYKQGKTYISDKQLLKIENGIHNLGKEFSELKLV